MRFRYGFKRLADQGRHLMTSIYHLPFSVFLSFRGESQSVYGCEQLPQKKGIYDGGNGKLRHNSNAKWEILQT